MNIPELTVLLVEDNPTDALLVREALAATPLARFAVTHTETLSQALNILSQEDFNIALVDLGLPDSQGMDTCRRLCATHFGLPVIVLTMNDDQDLALRVVNAGAQDYLVKNKIEEDSLVRAIRYAIERQRAEQALRESEERFRQLAEHIREVFWIYDPIAQRVLYVSPAYEHIWGRSKQVCFREPMGWFEGLHPDDRIRVQEAFQRTVTEGRYHEEYRIIRPDEEIRWIRDRGFPIQDAQGSVYRVVGIAEDMTDHKIQEEERHRRNKLESLSILAGGIAHDFNNLLTAILGNISLSKTSIPPDSRVFHQLTNAEKASLHAKDLSQQLLTFAKGGTPVKTLTKMDDLIREAAAFALTGSNVHARFMLPADLWLCEVDHGQIRQVIHNLVLNAQQAMPTGGRITIHGDNVHKRTGTREDHGLELLPGDYVKISITDEGTGMPKDYLSRIFDPYFTTKDKGSGLGLATAYAIIDNHGGMITVDSTLGMGTTFSLYLPASPEAADTMRRENEATQTGTGTILVMDDDPSIRELLKGMLTHLGYSVEVTCDGKEAIQLYKEAHAAGRPFAAVIMDLTVPGGMGGAEALQQLRTIHPQVKAIVSSGYSTDPIMGNYAAFGFSAVMAKPYRLVELSRTVQSVLYDQADENLR